MEIALKIPNIHQKIEVVSQAFGDIMDAWLVSKTDQKRLLGLTEIEYQQWQDNQLETLPKKSLNNLAHTFDIYKALTILFPNAEQAHKWPNKANPQFNGLSAISFILSDIERNLSVVHDYLDEQLVGLGDF
jgi:hypothetical protein